MAEFGFWGTWKDSLAITHAIWDTKSYYFIRDLDYDNPVPEVISELNDLERSKLQSRRHIYVGSPTFTVKGPYFWQQDGGVNAGKYFIDVSYDGPLMSYTLPPCFLKNDRLNLAPGTLSYQSKYWDHETMTPAKPSEEIKAAYRDLVKLMKKFLVRKTFEQPIWIGRDAVELYEKGEAIIHGFGKQWSKSYNVHDTEHKNDVAGGTG